jgi:hypothetical protein
MSEDTKPFTVKDRRHFTTEGESRPGEAASPAVTAASAPPAPDPAHEDLPPPPSGAIPADFAGLVVSLAAQATLLLGDKAEEDLEGARGVISLLEMLAEKTRGNLTADEERLLGDVLFQVRMAFVSRMRGPA